MLYCYIVILLGSPSLAFADFASAKSEYNDALTKYNQAYSDYLIAKNSHQTYQTLASLTEALEKSKIYLEKRDELIISHFGLLLEKIETSDFSSIILKESQKTVAGAEIAFYENHLGLIPALATLKDAAAAAAKSEAQIPSSNLRSKQILGQILIAKVDSLKYKYASLGASIEENINELKKNSSRKTKIEKLERWMVEVKNKQKLCENKLAVIKTGLANLKVKSTNLEQEFNTLRIDITQSSLYLKEGVGFMKEILEEMKYE